MTDEHKFMSMTLSEAVKVCGEMLADMDDNIGTPSLSVAATVTRGALTGKRVQLTFGIVEDENSE